MAGTFPAYTVGNKASYEEGLAAGKLMKAGATDEHEGGWVWRTREEAVSFLDSWNWEISFDGRPPVRMEVYGILLPNGWDQDVASHPTEDGIHRLLVDAEIVKLEKDHA